MKRLFSILALSIISISSFNTYSWWKCKNSSEGIAGQTYETKKEATKSCPSGVKKVDTKAKLN